MQSPKFLFAVGALSFAVWLSWLIYVDSARAPEPRHKNVVATAGDSVDEETKIVDRSDSQPDSNAESITDARAQSDIERMTPDGRTGRAASANVRIEPATQSPAEILEVGLAGDLSISGRLLNLAGEPVAGILLHARRQDQVGRVQKTDTHRGRSDANGVYTIERLLPGDYDVRTVATAAYPSTGRSFRAGLTSADIVLAGSNTVQLFGRVTDLRGTPLVQAEVGPGGNDAVRVWTDIGGNYRTQLTVANPGASYTVRFRRPGYLEERVHLPGKELLGQAEFRVDVELRRLDETTSVSGRLKSPSGDAVPGETVQLQSASLDTRYMASSKADGSFTMSNVEPAQDYRVTIHPRAAYESYWQQGVVVESSGTSLDITLQPLESGRLSGRMVDVNGYPLPGFSLLLKSTKSQTLYLPVMSDDGGYFVVENAPAGNLMFVTRSDPRFIVSGIRLEAGTAENVDIVIDWGSHELGGRVRDERGAAVAGAEVRLSWRYAGKGFQSTSLRRALSDGDGYFRFAQLGAGSHQLEVIAAGYQGAQQVYDVDSHIGDVSVTLRQVPQ